MKVDRVSYQTPLVLTIDIGSSAIKAGIYDATATPLLHTLVSIPHQQRTARDGMHEEDAEEILTAVEAAVDRVLTIDHKASSLISAVGMDSMASTILGLDAESEPVTPVFTYADTRSRLDVDELREAIDLDATYDRTGVMQHTSYVPGKVLWLRRVMPELTRKIALWSDISTFIYSRWFGRTDIPCSYSVAAWSGLLNRRELTWDADLLREISLDEEMLPRLTPYSHLQVGLRGEYRRRWHQLADVPFTLAVGDGAAANVGAGCIDSRNIALTIGSTAAMRLIAKDEAETGAPEIPYGLWGYRLGTDLNLVGGAFSEGGNVVEWAQRTLQMPDLDSLDASLQNAIPDGHGLTVLPFIAGERAVGWSTKASGVFSGITVSTTGLDIVQALMESVAYRFWLVSDLLSPHLDDDSVFVAGGGGSTNSTWWMQTMADVLQSEIHIPEDKQGTSRGAAVLALHAIGVWNGLRDTPPRIEAQYYPSDAHAETYRVARERQQELYSILIE